MARLLARLESGLTVDTTKDFLHNACYSTVPGAGFPKCLGGNVLVRRPPPGGPFPERHTTGLMDEIANF